MTSGAAGDAVTREVTRLLLVRHAQTEANVAGRSQGRLDLPLTAYGARQAAAVAETVAARAPTALYTSPARRAAESAEAIAVRCGLVVRTDPRLAEVDCGTLDGLTDAEMRAAAPGFLERWEADPSAVRMPGGESLEDARARMVAAVQSMAETCAGQTVAVVSHDLALHALLCHAMAAPLSAARAFGVDLASVSVVEVGTDGLWTLLQLNER